ncbi:MAG: hydrolase [Phycisphaerae bacterium]|nr:hydrolase [Phycisphaerae bacterium]NUQ44432.1 hydrolase [Phycisphaerae bacterium]
MRPVYLAESELALLLVIDMQQRLMPHIADHESVVDNAVRMIRAARLLSTPLLATEQNPRGLGETIRPVIDALPPDLPRHDKEMFSCWGDAAFRERLQAARREHVIVVGIEAHVCVQQTVLDLLQVDYVPFVLADAVGSRRPRDRDLSLERMRQAGAIVTSTEAMIMELQRSYTAPTFKQILKIVK